MREAVAAYNGPVRQCPPGKPRAPTERVIAKNKSVEWLKKHRHDQRSENPKAKRRWSRLARYEKARIAARNAALLGRIPR